MERWSPVPYIGVMIFNDAEKSPIKKLLKATEPPVEPVLSLIINVDYGVPHHHQMMLPLFMRNVHKPEASPSCQHLTHQTTVLLCFAQAHSRPQALPS